MKSQFRRFLVVTLPLAVWISFFPASHQAAGDLDLNFGNGGKVTTDDFGDNADMGIARLEKH